MYFLHRAKCICSIYELYLKKVQKLSLIFNNNGYSNWFIDNTFKKFEEQPAAKITVKNKKKIPFLFSACRILEILHANLLKNSVLVKRKFNVDNNVYYTISETGSYYRLKCSTLLSLMSNIVYNFNCSCDADLSYIGMTTRHLSVRVREHLHTKVRSAVGKHIDNCHVCKEKPVGVNDFKYESL